MLERQLFSLGTLRVLVVDEVKVLVFAFKLACLGTLFINCIFTLFKVRAKKADLQIFLQQLYGVFQNIQLHHHQCISHLVLVHL